MPTTTRIPKALTLISRLEERKLDEFKRATQETEKAIQSAALTMSKSWFSSLVDFCGGDVNSGLRAADKAPFFEGVPGEARSGLVTGSDLSNGCQLLKKMTCWNRAYRRRLLRSDNWVVHFSSGKGPNPAFTCLESGNCTLLEIDVLNSSILNVDSQELWDVIAWGCVNGKVSAIIGGPPCRAFSRLRNRQPGPPPVRSRQCPYGWEGQPESERQEMIRDTRLFCKMIWAHAMAVAGRVASKDKKPSIDTEVAQLSWYEQYKSLRVGTNGLLALLT